MEPINNTINTYGRNNKKDYTALVIIICVLALAGILFASYLFSEKNSDTNSIELNRQKIVNNKISLLESDISVLEGKISDLPTGSGGGGGVSTTTLNEMLLSYYQQIYVYNKSEVYNISEIDGNFSLYLLAVDQRYNDTTLINSLVNSLNTTSNIMSLGFYNDSYINNEFANYYNISQINNNLSNYLLLTDQRYNDTALINSINTTLNIMALGFYNTTQVDDALDLKYNATNPDSYVDDGNTLWDNIYGFWDTLLDDWFYNTGTGIGLNETKLNDTFDDRLATTYYNGTSANAVAGIIDGGTLVDTQHPDGGYDGITFNFSEASGSPGLDLRINFTSIDDFNKGYMRYKTSSLSGDAPLVQLWDYDDNEWEGGYGYVFESTNDFFPLSGDVLDSSEHIQDGVVQMRLYKSSNGNTQNHYYVDMLTIVKGYATPSGNVNLDPYAKKVDYRNLTNNKFTDNINVTSHNITDVDCIIYKSGGMDCSA